MSEIANMLGDLACHALLEELITYPKPGLVSHIDNGSHHDMNYSLFLASIKQLKYYFMTIAQTAANQHSFFELETLGQQAEKSMLLATNNINTHRGAIFVLGLITAVSAYCIKNQRAYDQVCQTIPLLYTDGLLRHTLNPDSHGAYIRKRYQLESVIDAALAGFPLLIAATEQLSQFKIQYDYEEAKLRVFFYIMQYLDDTNLIYRGGINGLQFARVQAKQLLAIHDATDFRQASLALHYEFINRNLSPGGCADMLAAIIFLDEVKQLWV